MTREPTALKTSDPIGHLLHLMSLHGFRHIPIVDPDGRPVGLASFKVMLQFTGGLFRQRNLAELNLVIPQN